MKKSILLLLCTVLSASVFAQSTDFNLSFLSIPKELTENANAVVRNESKVVTIESVDKMIVEVNRVVTVLNKLGQSYVGGIIGYDSDKQITYLTAEVYDAIGNRIKKIRKNDFQDFSGSGSDLYNDNRIKRLDYTPTQYPYTVKLTYQYKTSTTGFIPRWNPIRSHYLGIQESHYKLINKTSGEVRVKENNFKKYSILKRDLGNGFDYELKNIKPVKYEEYSLDLSNMMPEVKVALSSFSLKGISGGGDNWKDFGKWMYDKLLAGRSELPEATVNKVKELTKHKDNPIEKARIVYKFVQDKTRYISVQVGIGGWEPIAANQVDKVGYGDCKGLTNYTKALLDAVGVTSYYTVVYADEQINIDKDFASMQGTHVILNIPDKDKDIWLECTSQTMPFGFLGDFTDDRDVLVVTPEGGVIKRTPAYLNTDNLQVTNAVIHLDDSGSLKAQLIRKSRGIQYDNIYPIENESDETITKYYKSGMWRYNNNLEIASVDFENDKGAVQFVEKLDVHIKDYASLNQDEYIFRVNVFNMNNNVPKRYRKRKMPLKVSRGYKDVDEYTIKIPQGYSIEVLPEKISIANKFGEYQISIEKVDEKTLLYKKNLLIKDGVYPKEDYAAYRKFRRTIARYDNLKIALKKS